MRRSAVAPVPHEKLTLDPGKAPRKHAIGPGDGQLHPGALVFYHGERYWVSICPDSWDKTHYVRITSRPLVRDPYTNGTREDLAATSFFCHADCIDFVKNVPKKYGARQPTIKSLERAKRAKAGMRDVGDEIANALRGLTLEEIFVAAAEYLGEDVDELSRKYAHLDNGRKRMVLGNRMRAKFRKESA